MNIGTSQRIMELKDKVRKSFFWVISTRIVDQGAYLGAMVILARLLSPEDFGLIAIALVFVGVVDSVNEFGLGEAIIQKKDLGENDLYSAFWFSILLALILYLILFFAAPLIAEFYDRAKLVIIIRLLGLNFLFSLASLVPRSLLTKELAFEKLSKADVGSTLMYSFCAVILAIEGYGIWSLIVGSLLRYSFLSILTFYYLPWKPKFIFSIKQVSGLLTFGVFVTGGSILRYFYSNSDYLIVGRFLGTRLLGYYTMAFQLATFFINELGAIVVRISFPIFSKLQDDRESLASSFLRVTRYISLLSFPLFIGGIILSRDLVEVFLTSKWFPILLPFQVLCGIGLLRSIDVIIPPLLNSKNRPGLNFMYNLICSIIMPVGFLVGVKHGIPGISYAWLIIYPFLFMYLLSFGIKLLNVPLIQYLRNLFPSIIGTLFMGISTFLVIRVLESATPILRLAIGILFGITSYVCFFAIFQQDLISDLKRNLVADVFHGNSEGAFKMEVPKR